MSREQSAPQISELGADKPSIAATQPRAIIDAQTAESPAPVRTVNGFLDSTSDLLAHLNLIENNNGMSDPVFEVPDTPDRMAMAFSVDGSPSALPSGRRTGHTSHTHAHRRQARLRGEDCLVIEVPDTPDRLAMVHCIDGSPGASPGHPGSTRARRQMDSKQARRKRLISKTLDSKASPESPCRKSAKTVGLSRTSPRPSQCKGSSRKNRKAQHSDSGIGFSFSGDDLDLELRDNCKGIDLVTDPEAKTEQVPPKRMQLDASQKKMGQRLLESNDYVSCCNVENSNIQSKADGQNNPEQFGGETFSSFAGIRDQHNREQADKHRHAWYANWDKNVAKDNARKMSVECPDGDLSDRISMACSDSEANLVERKKGKLKLDDNTAEITHNMQCQKAKTPPGRACWTSDKEVTVIADVDVTSTSSEDLGWRTTRHHTEKPSSYSSHESADASKREDTDNNNLSEQSHELSAEDRVYVNLLHDSPEIAVSRDELNSSLSRAFYESESERRRRSRRQKDLKAKGKGKGKGKYSSLHSMSGESSSSVFEDSELSHLQSSRWGPNSKSITTLNFQRPGTITGSVIDVDEVHSPEVRCSSSQGQSFRDDDSSTRSKQVESDEILARQLQEQFYHEFPGSGGMEETDASIAWSLQEEDAQRAASITRRSNRRQLHPRDASIAHLYRHYSPSSLQHASSQLPNHSRVATSRIEAQLRRNFNFPEMDRETRMLAQLRRNLNSAEMDGEMRDNFVEALEAAFENTNDMMNSNFYTQRDFNEYDYEELLALDDDNHEHAGASETQINSLPQSIFQNDSSVEECAICLEVPCTGDVVRHLPCLHKFHKECIDTWLRRRPACPICKTGIT